MNRVVISGQDVFDAKKARKIAALGDKKLYESESLSEWQRSEARYGIVEAEIVKSNYGYSVRYASGLNDFALIASARRGDIDGSLDAAIEYAKGWQSQDRERRFVTISESDLASAPQPSQPKP